MKNQTLNLKLLLADAGKVDQCSIQISLLLSGHLPDPEAVFKTQYPEVWPQVKALIDANRALRAKLTETRAAIKTQVNQAMVTFLRELDPDLEVLDEDSNDRFRCLCVFQNSRGDNINVVVTGVNRVCTSQDQEQFDSAFISIEKNSRGGKHIYSTAGLYRDAHGKIIFSDQD